MCTCDDVCVCVFCCSLGGVWRAPLTQMSVGRFVDVSSTHVMDGSDHHQFAFEIVRCSSDTATGMRVGVCSADGTQQWLLRLCDARLCDASGRPVSSDALLEKRHLPSRYMGCRVEVRCNMAQRTCAPKALERV
jgi:hypothetical protein